MKYLFLLTVKDLNIDVFVSYYLSNINSRLEFAAVNCFLVAVLAALVRTRVALGLKRVPSRRVIGNLLLKTARVHVGSPAG